MKALLSQALPIAGKLNLALGKRETCERSSCV